MNEAATGRRKIHDLEDLASILDELRAEGKRIVHCHGVFDLLHIGHIRHFEAARKFGDLLVVTLTPDIWVNKGPHRPAFTEKLRAEALASLEHVDFVAINRWPMAIETIKLLRPDFYAKGDEFRDTSKDVTGAIAVEQETVESIGGKMVFTEDVTFSSSNLINRHIPLLSDEASKFCSSFALNHTAENVLGYLEGCRPLKVLVVGETVIDEYNYCETLGVSGKDPILAVRLKSTEKFAGGILAVANHLSSFADRVSAMSFLGHADSQEAFIREKLNPAIDTTFFYMANAPTITKKRFIESYPFQKMFEVYLMNDDGNAVANNQRFCQRLQEQLPRYDLVLVSDHGHGAIGPEAVEILAREAKCLAINPQTNAGNHGFNTVSKYPRADYVCVSEKEIRMEVRERHRDLHRIVENVADRLGARMIAVTRGSQGILCYGKAEGACEVPALARHFTDRMGAGDAVFSLTSLAMAQQAPADIVGLIGNAAGAMAVGTVGNRSSIDRTELARFVISLFK